MSPVGEIEWDPAAASLTDDGLIALRRYEHGGVESDFQTALGVLSDALELLGHDADAFPAAAGNLAEAWYLRYTRTGLFDAFERACEWLFRARVAAGDDLRYAVLADNANVVFGAPYRWTPPPCLSEADRLAELFGRLIADAADSGYRDTGWVWRALSVALRLRLSVTRDDTDLAKAAEASEQAGLRAEPGSTEADELLTFAVAAWNQLTMNSGSSEPAGRAAQAMQRLVDGLPVRSPDRPGRLLTLAMVLLSWHQVASEPVALDRAGRALEEAVLNDACADASTQRSAAITMVQVAQLYQASGQSWALLDRAIDAGEHVLPDFAVDDPQLATLLINLGSCRHHRFVIGGGRSDLDRALELHRRGYACAGVMSADRAGAMGNIATCLLSLADLTGELTYVDEALEVLRPIRDGVGNGAPIHAEGHCQLGRRRLG